MILINRDNINCVKSGDYVKLVLNKDYNYHSIHGTVIEKVNGPSIELKERVPSRTNPELSGEQIIHLLSGVVHKVYKFSFKESIISQLNYK